MKHITVLQTEAVDALDLTTDSVVVDATLGSGGHAKAILERLGADGTYIGIDADQTAIDAFSAQSIASDASMHLVCDNFRNIAHILATHNIAKVDAVLADLGWRTEQFVEGTKGFSFNDPSPLCMTYGDPADYAFTADDIVNEWEEEHIADVIFGYGEERQSRRIAKAIVAARQVERISSAQQLGAIVADAIPARFHPKRIHPATRTFQALRIAVNDELGAVGALIEDGFAALAPKGRMAIITFHSIEDRLVKRLFLEKKRDHAATVITKKPIIASTDEQTTNQRARSAKLRILEKL